MKPINQAISIQLLKLAKESANNAYAPYSGFSVGAALITEEGKIFTGCNVENASYGLTLCAERNAIANMVANGSKTFEAIAISAVKSPKCFPCGACRQWLYEFAPKGQVIVEDEEGIPLFTTVNDLLPEAFGPSNLK